jgi:uncharacterized protein YbjT (DUF2867 family)
MTDKKQILVAGGTGQTGRILLPMLVEAGYGVRVLARRVEEARHLLGDGLEIVAGDVRDGESLMPAFQSNDIPTHLICMIRATYPYGKNSPKHVDYGGVKHLVEVATQVNLPHFILVSSTYVTRPPAGIFNLISGKELEMKWKGEQVLRNAGIPYTIIRPGGLKDDLESDSLEFGQGDRLNGQLRRDQLATVCLQVLAQAARNVTFEVVGKNAGNPPPWDSILQTLQPD